MRIPIAWKRAPSTPFDAACGVAQDRLQDAALRAWRRLLPPPHLRANGQEKQTFVVRRREAPSRTTDCVTHPGDPMGSKTCCTTGDPRMKSHARVVVIGGGGRKATVPGVRLAGKRRSDAT